MTKADKSSKADKWALSPQQESALDLLACGRNITDTAAAVGIARQTLSDWLHHHCGFQAALTQRRADVWRDCADKVRFLLSKSLDVFESELDGENRLKAAEGILKIAGLFGNGQPPQLKTANEIETEQAVDKAERDSELRRRDFFANT